MTPPIATSPTSPSPTLESGSLVDAAPFESLPRRFGNYFLLEKHAQGGMGEVYLAQSAAVEGAERLCVVKKLRSDLDRREEYVRRFLDELRVVVQLNHPHIGQVYDVGVVSGEPYLAMEYIAGIDLRELLYASVKQKRTIPVGIAISIVAQLLDALHYAHSLRHSLTSTPLDLIHRDISPQNVRVTGDGVVKLIDFGLATSELKEEVTESAVVMGKVAYMSPEQARGDNIDATCDQFAVGVLLYELLTGQRFYGKRTSYEIWQVVGHGDVLPDDLGALPGDLVAILKRAWQKQPADRYQSCGAMRVDLEAFVREHPTHRASVDDLNQFIRLCFAKLGTDDGQRRARLAELSEKARRLPSFDVHTSATLRHEGYSPTSRESGLETTDAVIKNALAYSSVPSAWRKPLAAVVVVLLFVVVGWRVGWTVGSPEPEDLPLAVAPALVAIPTEVSVITPTERAPEPQRQTEADDVDKQQRRETEHRQNKPVIAAAITSPPETLPTVGAPVDDAARGPQHVSKSNIPTHREVLQKLAGCQLPCAGILQKGLSPPSDDEIPRTMLFTATRCMTSCAKR